MTRDHALGWMIITQAACLAGLAPWLLTALLGFGVPGTPHQEPIRQFLATIVWLAPAWPIGFAGGAWIAYRRHRYRKAILRTVLASLFVLPFIALTAYYIVGGFAG